MQLYRICKKKYAQDLSGEGAKLYGGRWNRPGVSALYTSQHRSLALLELIVHFTSKKALKNSYCFITLEVPSESIHEVSFDQIPEDFLKINNRKLWELTDYYFFDLKALAIQVPSVLIKNEFNVILNPQHEKFKEVKPTSFEPAFIDERYSKMF